MIHNRFSQYILTTSLFGYLRRGGDKMKELKETTYNQYSGENKGSIYTSEKKMINKLLKYAAKYPGEVNIIHTNDDGSIVCEIPSGWFKITPKIKRVMTDEEKAQAKLRAAKMREKQLNKISNDL